MHRTEAEPIKKSYATLHSLKAFNVFAASNRVNDQSYREHAEDHFCPHLTEVSSSH